MKAHSDYMYDDQVWMHLLCSCWFYVPRSVMPQRNTVTFDVPMGFFIPVINLKSEVGHLLHGWTAQSGLKITVSRMTVASAALLQACGQRCCRLPSVALVVSPSCPLPNPIKKNTTFTVCRGWRYCPTHPPSILILPLHPSILIIPSQPNAPASPFDCNTSLTHIIKVMWNSQLRHIIFRQLRHIIFRIFQLLCEIHSFVTQF